MITGAFCGVGAGLAGNLLVAASESVGVTCLSNIVQSMGTAFFSGFSGAFLGECVASKIDNAPINIEKTAISSVSVGLLLA